jgi:protein-L-isoaspartate(D-aspartate) O-methyltransferase
MGKQQDIERMLNDIRAHTRYSYNSTGRETLNARVLNAVAQVPRDAFVPPHLKHLAYSDGPLPIGQGQTISQPFIVALMTDLINPTAESRVLEVGTGCGYQSAVLAELVARVYSVEIIPELSRAAGERLEQLGYTNVETKVGDGYYGWAEQAPFDGILVTAAAEEIPSPLVEQLAPGACMVIPVGGLLFGQELLVVEKDVRGKVRRRNVLPVAFVPLTGSHYVAD